MSRQLTSESREKLHNHLNNKITKADLEVKKLINHWTEDPETKEIIWGEPVKKPCSEVLEKKIKGYTDQIENCQLSLRMVHNTGWISEWRDEHIKVAKIHLEKELLPKLEAAETKLNEESATDEDQKRLEGLKIEIDLTKAKIKNLTRAKGCNKKDCYGRGYIGFNSSTGEYAFCTCTIKTKHYFNVNKTSD